MYRSLALEIRGWHPVVENLRTLARMGGRTRWEPHAFGVTVDADYGRVVLRGTARSDQPWRRPALGLSPVASTGLLHALAQAIEEWDAVSLRIGSHGVLLGDVFVCGVPAPPTYEDFQATLCGEASFVPEVSKYAGCSRCLRVRRGRLLLGRRTVGHADLRAPADGIELPALSPFAFAALAGKTFLLRADPARGRISLTGEDIILW